MNNYIVSARKYRPDTFKTVVGQNAITKTLKNAITKNMLAHAYLFCGPRGVGKTTCARIFAKTINCLNPTSENESCNNCESCTAFNEQRSFNIYELDAASNNSVNDIRSLIDQVRILPQLGKYKVYIIDEVHMLSTSAFNSFLKTLEEPPAHAIFILATTEKHKIIPTILSRCQVYDFNRITISDTVEYLKYVAKTEDIKTEEEGLNIIAQKADGSMRDALSIFDQIVSYTNGSITYKSTIENLNIIDYEYFFKFTSAVLKNNIADCLITLNDILKKGFEGHYIINGLASHFRDLLISKDNETTVLLEVGASIKEKYIQIANNCSNELLYKAIDIINQCDLNYRISKNKRLSIEIALIKLCQITKISKIDIEDKVVELKEINKSQPRDISKENASYSAEKQEHKEKPIYRDENKEKQNLGISISALRKTKEKEENISEIKTNNLEEKNNTQLFTEENVLKAWECYEKELENEKFLKNTMALYKPKLINNNEIEIVVNSLINKEYIDAKSIDILNYIKKYINNDNIKMSVKIAEKDSIKKNVTPMDEFKEMIKRNPAIEELSNDLGLELS